MTTPKTTPRTASATARQAPTSVSKPTRDSAAAEHKPKPKTTRPSRAPQIRVPDALESLLQEGQPISPERRLHMIRDAAYYRAERRGFRGGDAMRDWLEAEAEIDRLLGAPGNGTTA